MTGPNASASRARRVAVLPCAPPPQRLGVSVADWTAILASVTEIAISIDAFDGADTIGFDNFSLESSTVPVPEPGTLSLLQ